jgi:hypothetical protein
MTATVAAVVAVVVRVVGAAVTMKTSAATVMVGVTDINQSKLAAEEMAAEKACGNGDNNHNSEENDAGNGGVPARQTTIN